MQNNRGSSWLGFFIVIIVIGLVVLYFGNPVFQMKVNNFFNEKVLGVEPSPKSPGLQKPLSQLISVNAWQENSKIFIDYQDNSGGTNWVLVKIRNENTKEIVWKDNVTDSPNNFKVAWGGAKEDTFYTIGWTVNHENRQVDIGYMDAVFFG